MKIKIVCVNFNSYDELQRYLESIERAAESSPDAEIDVVVADNSTKRKTIDINSFHRIRVSVKLFNNLGYLGAAQKVINADDNIIEYNFVIISNVDILFSTTTIKELVKSKIDSNVAWIAPCIYSLKYEKDKNPNVLERYSKGKLSLLKLLFNRYLYRAYVKLIYANKGKKERERKDMYIYAGHGSCVILTKRFFEIYPKIDFPLFLYGEELYLAEMIYKAGLKVKYIPSIVIDDIGNVSTSKLPSSLFFKYNKEAISWILKNFY